MIAEFDYFSESGRKWLTAKMQLWKASKNHGDRPGAAVVCSACGLSALIPVSPARASAIFASMQRFSRETVVNSPSVKMR